MNKFEKCPYSNFSFDYFTGQRKSDKKDVTILKLKKKSIFKRLLSVLVKIDHPNVESFIGAYIESGKVTLITNRSGISLDNYLSLHKSGDPYSLKPGDKSILAFRIAQAMSYLHSRSVIHRNLNTTNIFIAKSSDEFINPIIVGFRNSRLLPSNPSIGLSTLNMKATDYQSSNFNTPEFNDSHTYDEKMDVFVFSAILYELLTGHPPFNTKNPKDTVCLLNNGQRPGIPKDTPKSLAELINSCWCHDPKNRFSFDKIMEVMSKNKIIFPFDEENRELVLKFYESNSIKCNCADECVNKMELIKDEIGNAFQYRFELLSARSILQTYQFELRRSEYSKNEYLPEDTNNKLGKLLDTLKSLESMVSKLSFVEFKPTKVTIDITNLMNNIHQSMVELGIDECQQYKEIDNDLVFDYRELDNYLNQKLNGPNYFAAKCEIDDFYNEKKLNGDVSKKALKERIKDLFSPFSRFQIDSSNLEFTQRINESFVSVVYKGRNKATNKDVAIKVISERHLQKGERNLILLRREVGYLTRLKHEYIADFIGFALSKRNNDVWLISDYIADGTLKQKIDLDYNFKGNEKTIVAFQIAELMNYLRSKRILHLDIKSTNFMMKDGIPKMIDFGFACSDNDVQKIKSDNIGTANYRAPEIFKGEDYDYKADVFSFAMLLWELYDNTHPYSYIKPENVHEIRSEILKGVNFIFDGDANDKLIELIQKGYDDDPKNRPSFDEILNIMMNENIMFPESNREVIEKFYESKKKLYFQT